MPFLNNPCEDYLFTLLFDVLSIVFYEHYVKINYTFLLLLLFIVGKSNKNAEREPCAQYMFKF